MAKPNYIELGIGKHAEQIPILYEDRSVLAIDKPPGWMLVPFSWQKTNRNLQAAITSSIAAGDFWARSRNLKFLKFVHRLDADTSGVLLFAKSQGGLESYSDLFESRSMEKIYLAVVQGTPKNPEWTCNLKLAQDPFRIGKMKVDNREGKDAETSFKVLETQLHSQLGQISLVEARPLTGRTHQIRVHLAESGHPIIGDPFYGKYEKPDERTPLGLRSIFLEYRDPFTRKDVRIEAPASDFLRQYRFAVPKPSSEEKKKDLPQRRGDTEKS